MEQKKRNQNRYPSYVSPEARATFEKDRKKRRIEKVSAAVLGLIMITAAAYGYNERTKQYDKQQIETTESFDDVSESQSPKFESNEGAIPKLAEIDKNEISEIESSFALLADNQVLVLEKGGSIRNSLFSGDIEHLSTILLSKEETTLNNVREVGSISSKGDNYYVVSLSDMPEEVKQYVKDNNIGLSEIDGNEIIFINKIDANIVTIEPTQEQSGVYINTASSDAASAESVK